jgi:death-on-curing protein
LKWALEIIQCPFLFGDPIYPLLHDTAALLAWTIINDHVFLDGNKRTAMATIKIMALSNGYPFSAGDDEIIDVAHKIRDYRFSGFTTEQLASWISGCMHV